MKVLKFGGGCLKDAKSIKKIPNILKKYQQDKIIVVLSAFGKITNMLENKQVDEIILFLDCIMDNLGFSKEKKNNILNTSLAPSLLNHNSHPMTFLELLESQEMDYPCYICAGEYISSRIVHAYLATISIENFLLDASLCIKTHGWNEKLNFAAFHSYINIDAKQPIFYDLNSGTISPTRIDLSKSIIITQGFIASEYVSEPLNLTSNIVPIKRTTLGREGSDYSAAIFATMFNAEEVVLFKDVDGIYNIDPKKNTEAKLFSQLSYQEAFEFCNHVDTVVHPKTIEHLQKYKIPLLIQNFYNINQLGTAIS